MRFLICVVWGFTVGLQLINQDYSTTLPRFSKNSPFLSPLFLQQLDQPFIFYVLAVIVFKEVDIPLIFESLCVLEDMILNRVNRKGNFQVGTYGFVLLSLLAFLEEVDIGVPFRAILHCMHHRGLYGEGNLFKLCLWW